VFVLSQKAPMCMILKAQLSPDQLES